MSVQTEIPVDLQEVLVSSCDLDKVSVTIVGALLFWMDTEKLLRAKTCRCL
jgi:hypothetical protein